MLQRDAMQCGVASLAMVCGWYGRRYSLTDMERHCHVTRQGVSLKGIMDAAKAVGLDSKAGKCTVDDLCTLREPCILHWRQEHFVVLYKTVKGKWFHIADRARGKVRLSRQEFEKDWLSTEQEGRSLGLIWLILIGELLIIAGRTATDFIRRWLLLHVAMRINITLKGDFFAKLLRLPMSFFEVKLTGDLLQRVGDHSRGQNFLRPRSLNFRIAGAASGRGNFAS